MKAMRVVLAAVSLAALTVVSTPAAAERWVDYTPQKGYWTIVAVEVDPNHVDDYLTGLRKSQMPALQVLQQHGLIDSYQFMVREGYVKGSPNVLIMTHSPSAALMDPNQARDEEVQKQIYSLFSKEEGDKAVAGYEKYRTFLDNGDWRTIVMNK